MEGMGASLPVHDFTRMYNLYLPYYRLTFTYKTLCEVELSTKKSSEQCVVLEYSTIVPGTLYIVLGVQLYHACIPGTIVAPGPRLLGHPE